MSNIKNKVGICIDCKEEGDETPKVIIANRCANFHYKIYRAEVNRAKNESKEVVEKKPFDYMQNSSKRKYLNPVGKKRASQLRKYYKIRIPYLEENNICMVDDCNNPSNQIHHKAGRENELLIYVPYFMAVCGDCHPGRIHDEEPGWAKEKGYLIGGVN